jgi:hypothetical protein
VWHDLVHGYQQLRDGFSIAVAELDFIGDPGICKGMDDGSHHSFSESLARQVLV